LKASLDLWGGYCKNDSTRLLYRVKVELANGYWQEGGFEMIFGGQ
jgi:hypothetical protein